MEWIIKMIWSRCTESKKVPTVLCSQAEMQAFIDQVVVLSLLLVFKFKIIGPYGICHTPCLLTQLPLLFVPLNGLKKNNI